MDGWGSLTMLIKRQEAAKFRKAALRSELKKRKLGFLHEPFTAEDEFDFPEVSKYELDKIKADIRKKYRRERIVQICISILILVVLFYVLYLVF